MEELKELLLPGWEISRSRKNIILVKYANGCKYVIIFLLLAKSYSAKFGSSAGASYELPYQISLDEHMMIHKIMKALGWF